MIRLLIVDDHTIVRDGIRDLIMKSFTGVETDDASNLKHAMDMLKSRHYDLVLLDYQLKDGLGIDLSQYILELSSPPKVIILTAHEEENIIMQCIQAGVNGILMKTSDVKRIVDGVQSVLNGVNYYDSSITHKIVCFITNREFGIKLLNENECEILKFLAKGMSNREIALNVHMSEKTIRNYLSIIYEKIKVKNRTEAVLYYQSNIKRGQMSL